jgi:hypothetical protein
MLVIKTPLCVLLLCAQTQLNERKAMICKGWGKKAYFKASIHIIKWKF